jgi:hypothetical protein
MDSLGIPVETGVFSGIAPDVYVVFIPLGDDFPLIADDKPQFDAQEVRISIFSKGNYLAIKKQITRALLAADMTITGRHYAGYENDTGYHNMAIDIAKAYEMEDDY